ncbi:hypothetical protein DVH24_023988 [Malus domestica]|uniref:14-3-3 domain-containing protein n=1 Tax=Malus domestica TaxID=3750 RepID=A0A498JK47_MALDO|nr:hypothetical protein DVH24_023988 [Malus domestica]
MQIQGRIYVVPRPPILCINIWHRLWESIQKVMSVFFHFFTSTVNLQKPKNQTPAQYAGLNLTVQEHNLLTVEEHNLLSIAYKNVIGSLRTAWGIISLIEQKEEGCRNEEHVAFIKQYKSKVETKLSAICTKILELLQSHLVLSATNGESKVFYLNYL